MIETIEGLRHRWVRKKYIQRNRMSSYVRRTLLFGSIRTFSGNNVHRGWRKTKDARWTAIWRRNEKHHAQNFLYALMGTSFWRHVLCCRNRWNYMSRDFISGDFWPWFIILKSCNMSPSKFIIYGLVPKYAHVSVKSRTNNGLSQYTKMGVIGRQLI